MYGTVMLYLVRSCINQLLLSSTVAVSQLPCCCHWHSSSATACSVIIGSYATLAQLSCTSQLLVADQDQLWYGSYATLSQQLRSSTLRYGTYATLLVLVSTVAMLPQQRYFFYFYGTVLVRYLIWYGAVLIGTLLLLLAQQLRYCLQRYYRQLRYLSVDVLYQTSTCHLSYAQALFILLGRVNTASSSSC